MVKTTFWLDEFETMPVACFSGGCGNRKARLTAADLFVDCQILKADGIHGKDFHAVVVVLSVCSSALGIVLGLLVFSL